SRFLTSRSIWKLTSRYIGIDVDSRHSMKTPVSLTSRVVTQAKRVVPRESLHVMRPGSTSGLRSALVLLASISPSNNDLDAVRVYQARSQCVSRFANGLS